jgi:hypothetical protein
MSDALDRVCEALRDRGYRVEFPTDRGAPAAVATPQPGSDPVAADGPLAVEPLDPAHVPPARSTTGVDPTTVVDRVADAAPERTCLFVVDAAGAAAVREILTDPPAVRAVDDDGCRTFYHVPDRLSTPEGLGCVRADGPLTWREEPATGGIRGNSSGSKAEAADADAGTDRRLVLTADGTVHAAFADYAALACPTAEAFPYTYRRGEDRRIHVRSRDGRTVGVYPSVRAMKADAYEPIPDPLLPEVHLPDGVRLRRAWGLAVVGVNDDDDAGRDATSVRFQRA